MTDYCRRCKNTGSIMIKGMAAPVPCPRCQPSARKARWQMALKEGRIVRHNEGQTMTEYRTAEAARAVVNALREDGEDAEIVIDKEAGKA